MINSIPLLIPLVLLLNHISINFNNRQKKKKNINS